MRGKKKAPAKARQRRVHLVSEARRAEVRQLGIEEMKCQISHLKAEIAARSKEPRPRGTRVPSIREQQVLAKYSMRGLFGRAERNRRAEGLGFNSSGKGTEPASNLLARQARRYIDSAIKSGRRPRIEDPAPVSSEEVLRCVARAREEQE